MKHRTNTSMQASEPASSQSAEGSEPLGRPFILGFLVPYPGAANPTTTGTWDNMDGSDYS